MSDASSMNDPIDEIPVLTDFVDEESPAGLPPGDTSQLLLELEAHLTAAVHEHADELVHNACRDLEALLLEHVSDRLRSDLPGIVAAVIEQHLRRPARLD
jgi:hypothetical protein